MLKGFFFTGMVAALVCAVILYVTEPHHQVAFDTAAAFTLTIAFLAGGLGAAVALTYHLALLDALHHGAQHYSEQRAAQRQQRSAAH
jgi:hypothetical protein